MTKTQNNNYILIVSLVASRFCLALVAWIALIIVMLLIMTLLLVEKENTMDEMLPHYFGFTKLHSHLFTQQSQYIFLSFLARFFTSTHHWLWTHLKLGSFISSFFALLDHTIFNSWFVSFTKMKSRRPKIQVLKESVSNYL
jgi:hypothetical protein